MDLKTPTAGFVQFLGDIEEYIGKPNCILDIGARECNESRLMALKFPQAKIFAFEPAGQNFKDCLEAVKGTEIEVFKLALSNYEGEAKFYYTPANVGASSLLFPTFVPWANSNEVQEETVVVKTLDNWVKACNVRPDVIHIDCQGAELSVFQGAIETLKNVKIILTEAGLIPYYVGHQLKDSIVSFLEKSGFEVIRDEIDWSHETNLTLINRKLI